MQVYLQRSRSIQLYNILFEVSPRALHLANVQLFLLRRLLLSGTQISDSRDTSISLLDREVQNGSSNVLCIMQTSYAEDHLNFPPELLKSRMEDGDCISIRFLSLCVNLASSGSPSPLRFFEI